MLLQVNKKACELMLMKIYCREGFNLYLAFDQARAFLLVLGLKLVLSLASTIVNLAI